MASVAITIRKNRKTAKGECPLYMLVCHEKKNIYKAIGIKVQPKHFNPNPKNMNFCSGPDGVYQNTILKREYERITTALLQLQANGLLNTETIRDALWNEGRNDHSLYLLGCEFNDSGHLAPASQKKYREYCSFIKKHFPKVSVTALTAVELSRIEKIARPHLSQNSLWGLFKYIKTVINYAIDKKGMDIVYPFGNRPRQYKAPAYKNPERSYLSSEQLDRIWEVALTHPDDTVQTVTKWFLLGCYSGLRFSDLQRFDGTFIRDGHLHFYDTKTKSPHLLPIVPGSQLERAVNAVEGLPKYTNQAMNRILKVVTGLISCPFVITVHTSRHTFATRYLTAGGSIEKLSRLLGHTNTRTTSIYGKITQQSVVSEAGDVFGRM